MSVSYLLRCVRAASAALPAPPSSPLLFVQCRYAGHSHWQNIRHIKAEKDANKQRQTEKFVRLIETAVRQGGGPDPKLNRLLSYAVENAKRTQVVSNAAIEAAIKRGSGQEKPKNLRPGLHEIIGEGGVLVLVESESNNVSKFVHDLKIICKKHKFGISKGGVKEMFFVKGIVTVAGHESGEPLDADKALETALEGGCEEIDEIGEGDSRRLEFICDPQDTFKLAKQLASNGYQVAEAELKYLPFKPVNIDSDLFTRVEAFCDDLEEHEAVQNVHTNIA